MGHFIYDILIHIFNLIILIYSKFNTKAKLLVEGRRKTFKIINEKRVKEEKCLWFHCASLGEFEQAMPLIEKIKEKFPHFQLFISFFSPSGFEHQRNNSIADGVFYLPADTRSNARSLLELLDPIAVFFIKYEFWYNYLKTCNDKKIPVFSVSTILRPDQVFFKFYGSLYREMLRKFNYFFVQNQETLDLLKSIGLENAIVSGDTRFDRVDAILKKKTSIIPIEKFAGDSRLIVLGSTWKKDIDLWMHYINQSNDLKFIIAPHNITEEEISYIEERIQLEMTRYSNIREDMDKVPVLIIDNIGMLSTIYKYAYITYVGGAFGEGLHNILEPATFGKPVIFGKDKLNEKYHEVRALITRGGAYEVANPKELEHVMNDLLRDVAFYKESCQASRSYIVENLGSADAILENIKTYLS
jgi:3-deoxy-D-manno-octulosonic-acid transferase